MKLNAIRFSGEEYNNTTWSATVPHGTTLDDLLNPEYFANVSYRMHPYDRIHVKVDSGEWYAELLVVSCGRTWARMATIFHIDLTTRDVELTQAEIDDKYEVCFKGPHLKFCIMRKSDKAVIKEEIGTKAEAQAWLSSYLLTI